MFFLKGFLDFLTVWFRKPKFLIMCGVLVGCVVTMFAVYGMRVVTDIPVYVVDHDNSTVSRTLRLFLDAGPDLEVLGTLETVEQGKELLMDGKIGGIIYIPDGLSQAVKTQNGGHVFAYIDGTNMLMAKNVDKAVQTVVKIASVGVSMIAVQKQGMPDYALMGALQPISLDVEKPFNALTIYSEYLLPVLVFFCLNIFTCIMTCACFQEAVPENIQKHKVRRRFFYFGRLCFVFIAALIIGLFIYQKGLPRVDIVIQSAPFMALSSLTLYLLLTICFFTIFYLILPGTIAMSLSYITCMLSVMFSGLTWPLEMMPWYLQEFASWIPMTPFLQSVQVFLYHDANWGDLWVFYQMFVKQLILFLCVIFVAMRIRDVILIAKWLIHKMKREKEISPELEEAASRASQKLSAILLDKERETLRSSKMLKAIAPENKENKTVKTETPTSTLSTSHPTKDLAQPTAEMPQSHPAETPNALHDDAIQKDVAPPKEKTNDSPASIDAEAERLQIHSGLPLPIVHDDVAEKAPNPDEIQSDTIDPAKQSESETPESATDAPQIMTTPSHEDQNKENR